ncbi:MAG TPA: glycosyltransferase family 4 protein [Candidatus Saccharimonadales bacterium]|nr:glycosyltransferase family 4 protein [Candidatus Saccharimonadales bacterium]
MAKALKIGLVLDTSLDPPDGVQQYVVSIGEWLRGQGHGVHYLVGETKHRDLPNVHSLSRNITVQFNGNRTTIPLFASRKKIRQVLSANQFDVLHVQTPHHPFMAQPLILAAGKSTAIVGTFHIAAYDWLVSLGNRLLGIWLRPSLKRFYKIVAVSDAAADFARRTFHIDTPVIPNAFDYARFHNAKPFTRYHDKTVTILFLNRLVPRKGCRVLLEAAALLASDPSVPPFRVVVCGKGPEAPKLHRFIKQNGLGDIVEMVGFVSEEDKPRYYASADVAVFPSSAGESFGIVLLEAMASGRTAVLAGNNPGYRSVMSPRPELLFEPRDSNALAKLLENYIRTPGLRQMAAKWGRQYTKSFDVGVVGRQLEQLYLEARRALRAQQKT